MKHELNALDDFVAEQLSIWKTPGAAGAVVKDGEVIHASGYGLRDIFRKLPVTTDTIFPIASVTKSFTAAALSCLIDRGSLEWDKPVREYFPEFRLSDPMVSDRITTRDLITHRTGLPGHDWVWIETPLSRKELCLTLRHLDLSRDLRQTYQYNNLGYIAAGHVAEELTKSTWESLVAEMLLGPLGMKRTVFTVDDLQGSGDFALPYERDDDETMQAGAFMNLTAPGPAGGIGASIGDLARYLTMHLGLGRFHGASVLTERAAREMQTPQMVVPAEVEHPELGYLQYCLGFFTTTYRGHRHIRHDGGLRGGFTSIISFLPDAGIGVVVLTNTSPTAVPNIVANRVFDLLLGRDPLPWSQRALDARAAAKTADDAKHADAPLDGTPLPRPAADYAGTYAHPAYGRLSISTGANSTLGVDFRGSFSPLVHQGHGIFTTPPNRRNRIARTRFRFETGWTGNIDRVAVPFEPSVADIVFARQPGASTHVA